MKLSPDALVKWFTVFDQLFTKDDTIVYDHRVIMWFLGKVWEINLKWRRTVENKPQA